MSIHQSPEAMTSRQRAIENLPMDAASQRKVFDDLFAARERQREEIRRVREAQKVRDREDAMTANLGIDPLTIKSMRMWGDAFQRNDYKAAVAFTQFMIFANAQGWGDERQQPDDATPVMDRTKTARKLSGFNPAAGGARASYGMTIQNSRQLEITAIAERLYHKLKAGVPYAKLREGEGAGRPSNAWQEAHGLAVDRLAREQEEQEAEEASRPEAAE